MEIPKERKKAHEEFEIKIKIFHLQPSFYSLKQIENVVGEYLQGQP